MRKIKFFTLLLLLLLLIPKTFAQTDFSIDHSPLPPPTSPVMDYVGILDGTTKKSLEKRLIEFRKQTNIEIAVVIVSTTGERDIFDYSLAVARGWGIGSKEDDNPGLLLFIAFNDKKYFTQVSRDLEDELPDGIVGQIQRQYLVPAFRQGNYSKGITDTIEAYIQKIQEKQSSQNYSPFQNRNKSKEDSTKTSIFSFCFIIVVAVIILLIIASGFGKRKHSKGSVFFIFPIVSDSDWSSDKNIWGGGSWGGFSSSNFGSGGDWGGFGGGGDFGGGGAGGDF